MSTKIYNGAISNLSIEKLLAKLKDEIPNVKNILKEEYNKKLAEEATEQFDESEEDGIDLIKKIGEINSKNQSEIEEAKNDNELHGNDYNYNVIVFPYRKKSLILYYTDCNFFTKHLLNLPYIKDYHYQDSTDRPDKISKEDWEARILAWDTVLGGDGWGKPIENGYAFTLCKSKYLFLRTLVDINLINKYIPSDQKRKKRLLKKDVIDKGLVGVDKNQKFSAFYNLNSEFEKNYELGKYDTEEKNIKLKKIELL